MLTGIQRTVLAAAFFAAILVVCSYLNVNAPGPKPSVVAVAQQSAKVVDDAYDKAPAAKKNAAAKARQGPDKAALQLTAEQTAAATSPYFAWYGILALAILWLLSAVLAGDLNPAAIAMGADNRLSTSKFQVLLWTACVGFVYATSYATRVIVYGHVDPIREVPANVLFALGISVTSVVGAKAITSSQVSTDPDGEVNPPQQPSYDPAALVREDGATTASLTKVQLLFWTVVAIVVYIANAFHSLPQLAACTSSCSFPDIDTTLMIFMGLGHATYLGGKLVQTSAPTVSGVTAAQDATGPLLVAAGSGLGTSGTVLFNGTGLPDSSVVSWTPSSVSFRPPDGTSSGGAQYTIAISTGGTTSPPVTFAFQTSMGSTKVSPAPTVPPEMRQGDASATAFIHGLDVSFAQGDIDWDAVKNRGNCGFAYSRACYGSNSYYDDPNFGRNHDECKRLNIPFGAYHFYLFSESGADQAKHFLDRVNGRSGTLCPMVDIEAASGKGSSSASMIAELATFVQTVQKALSTQLIIYTSQSAWNSLTGGSDAFSGHKLWVADYTYDSSVSPLMPAGWRTWTIYQYSDKGSIPTTDGRTTSLDLDVLRGTLEDIRFGAAPVVAPSAASLQARSVTTSGVLASVVYNGVSKNLKGYDTSGNQLFKFDARNDSVAANAWRPDAGCPPGTYSLTTPAANDPTRPNTSNNDWIGEGLWFIDIEGIPDHEGIGIHGGGTCATPPDTAALAPRQGWCPTENCIRIQNEDLADLVKMPLDGIPIHVVQPP